jgi:hypothetical protein
MKRYVLLAIPALALALAGTFAAIHHADAQTAHPVPQAGRTVDLQGDQGAFADQTQMRAFYEILLETHKQGDKADLKAMEEKIVRRAELMFNEGKPISKGMQDHVLGVAHQALALSVSNPKIFESYESFMAQMAGPK